MLNDNTGTLVDGLVQFALTTEGIKIPEVEEEAEPEKEEGFFDRLKQLFQ